MAGDVLAAKRLTASGQLTDQSGDSLGRIRIKQIYIVNSSPAGVLTIYNGTTTSDPVVFEIATPVDAGFMDLELAGDGILADKGAYVVFSGATSVTVIYGG